jgi:hypothetical protein
MGLPGSMAGSWMPLEGEKIMEGDRSEAFIPEEEIEEWGDNGNITADMEAVDVGVYAANVETCTRGQGEKDATSAPQIAQRATGEGGKVGKSACFQHLNLQPNSQALNTIGRCFYCCSHRIKWLKNRNKAGGGGGRGKG